MKKRLFLILLIVTLLMPNLLSYAISNSVNVNVAGFDIMINGTKIDNKTADYPFISYNGITYLPMTWNLSRGMGLQTKWDVTNGLSVDSGKISAEPIKENQGTSSNSFTTKYTATVASFPVTVNGVEIDNSKEEYPVLTYKNITYFPLTWKFMVTSFGTDYSWDAVNGLTIRSKDTSLVPPTVDPVSSSVQTVEDELKNAIEFSNEAIVQIGKEGYKIIDSRLPQELQNAVYVVVVDKDFVEKQTSINNNTWYGGFANIKQQRDAYGFILRSNVKDNSYGLLYDSSYTLIGQTYFSDAPIFSSDLYAVSFKSGSHKYTSEDSIPQSLIMKIGQDYEIYVTIDGIKQKASGNMNPSGHGWDNGELFFDNSKQPIYSPDGPTAISVEILNPDFYLLGEITVTQYSAGN